MPYFAFVFVVLAGLTAVLGYKNALFVPNEWAANEMGQAILFILLIFAVISLVAEVVRQQKK